MGDVLAVSMGSHNFVAVLPVALCIRPTLPRALLPCGLLRYRWLSRLMCPALPPLLLQRGKDGHLTLNAVGTGDDFFSNPLGGGNLSGRQGSLGAWRGLGLGWMLGLGQHVSLLLGCVWQVLRRGSWLVAAPVCQERVLQCGCACNLSPRAHSPTFRSPIAQTRGRRLAAAAALAAAHPLQPPRSPLMRGRV